MEKLYIRLFEKVLTTELNSFSTDTYMIYDQIFTVHTQTHGTLIFYIYKPIGPAALVSVNNCLLLFFLLLGVIQYDGYGVLYKATESHYWLLLRKPKRGGTAQQKPSPIGASPWRNEEVKSNIIYLHTDYRLSTDFLYYLPQISGIVAPILSA